MANEIQKYNYSQHEWCIYRTTKSNKNVMEHDARLFEELKDTQHSNINFCWSFHDYYKNLNYYSDNLKLLNHIKILCLKIFSIN